jgi:DNA-binding NtrC family response regulator
MEAGNADEGMDKIKAGFFNAVISEIKMEKTTGIEFYQKSIEVSPHISRNFIFCSENISPESKKFLQDNHLIYFEKPINIKRFAQGVQDIMSKAL